MTPSILLFISWLFFRLIMISAGESLFPKMLPVLLRALRRHMNFDKCYGTRRHRLFELKRLAMFL
ncbi:Uncharacterised protein [Mycobacteroides abscessus subsp. abscessus]|nr:hypothetical protein B9K06_07675 [Bacillus sp. OG2]SIC03775.1 Uncharacterised protein [Mycobacteroides abscessus subsp. abscessus]